MKEIQRLAKSSVIYLLGNVGTKLVTFFLLPLYTKFISPDDYGAYDLSVTYVLLISSVLFLDIWSGIMRFMCDHGDKNGKYRTIYSGLVVFVGSLSLFTSVFLVIGPLLHIQTLGDLHLKYIWWIYGYGLVLGLANIYSYLSRGLGHNMLFALSGIVSTLVNALGNIVMIAVLHWDYRSLYIAYILGICAQCLILETRVKVISNFSFKKIDWDTVRRILLFSLPLSVNSVCYWLLTSYNKIVINGELGNAANGYYAIAIKFVTIVNLLTSCFSMAWQEVAYNKSGTDRGTGGFYSKATDLYLKLLLCGSFALIAVIYFIFPYFANASYTEAKAVIPLYMMAAIGSIFNTFLGNILTAYKKSPSIFYSTLAACLTNLVVVYLLIGPLGLQGASISLFCGYLVSNVIRIAVIGRQIHYRLDYKMFLYLLPLGAVAIGAYLMNIGWLNALVFAASSALLVLFFRTYLVRLVGKALGALRGGKSVGKGLSQ